MVPVSGGRRGESMAGAVNPRAGLRRARSGAVAHRLRPAAWRSAQATRGAWRGRRSHRAAATGVAEAPASTAIWTFPGKTTTSVAAAAHAPTRRVAAGRRAAPDAISARPVATTHARGEPSQRGTRRSKGPGVTRCSVPIPTSRAARARALNCDGVTPVLRHRPVSRMTG
jgi:hypothetical protein